MRVTVVARRRSGSLKAWDTAAVETPALPATAWMVTLRTPSPNARVKPFMKGFTREFSGPGRGCQGFGRFGVRGQTSRPTYGGTRAARDTSRDERRDRVGAAHGEAGQHAADVPALPALDLLVRHQRDLGRPQQRDPAAPHGRSRGQSERR